MQPTPHILEETGVPFTAHGDGEVEDGRDRASCSPVAIITAYYAVSGLTSTIVFERSQRQGGLDDGVVQSAFLLASASLILTSRLQGAVRPVAVCASFLGIVGVHSLPGCQGSCDEWGHASTMEAQTQLRTHGRPFVLNGPARP